MLNRLKNENQFVKLGYFHRFGVSLVFWWVFFFFFFNNRINSSVGDCRHAGLFGGVQKQHRNGGFPDWSVVVSNSKELLTGNCWPTSRAAFVPLLLSGSLVPGHVFPRSSRLLVLHGQLPQIHPGDRTFGNNTQSSM